MHTLVLKKSEERFEVGFTLAMLLLKLGANLRHHIVDHVKHSLLLLFSGRALPLNLVNDLADLLIDLSEELVVSLATAFDLGLDELLQARQIDLEAAFDLLDGLIPSARLDAELLADCEKLLLNLCEKPSLSVLQGFLLRGEPFLGHLLESL